MLCNDMSYLWFGPLKTELNFLKAIADRDIIPGSIGTNTSMLILCSLFMTLTAIFQEKCYISVTCINCLLLFNFHLLFNLDHCQIVTAEFIYSSISDDIKPQFGNCVCYSHS